ncbi:ABC transporter ATP-binding protein [Streptomyces sp. 8L]|uniref:ABC transporter ATP-binding protein n=1 Tax=Streptomyces sp. 8L TaxID=2877242 RepID=UPI001CD338E6|nr:ABC transporter ATP-binding protein [Streptomyces sp. 8L]MCA1222316.1 ABC transporter ATP-binding protein [Streptomyces sp. 8L]
MITAEGVSFAYARASILKNVALKASTGHVLGLIGPNGSGKTTFLRTLYAGLKPGAGLIRVDDTPIGDLSVKQVSRSIAVVSQESVGELPITVREMVLLGRLPHRSGFDRLSRADHAQAAAALRRVGARHLAERSYGSLSGGEKQRVLIARSLAQDARHLLLDEPTNHLDIRYQHDILQLVRSLDVTTVVVLHDLNLSARYCDELVLLDGGQVACCGTPDEVLVPRVLEPVYGIGIDRITIRGQAHLIFTPHGPGPEPTDSGQGPDRADQDVNQ